MSKRYKKQHYKRYSLEDEHYDFQMPNDLTTLHFNRHINPAEFNIIWFLLHTAKTQLNATKKATVNKWQSDKIIKSEILKYLYKMEYTFDMDKLKDFCDNDNAVKKHLPNITNITATTNTILVGIQEDADIDENHPQFIQLITAIGKGRKTKTFKVCPHTMYKVMLLHGAHFSPVSLLLMADIPKVRTKSSYFILCSYRGLRNGMKAVNIIKLLKSFNTAVTNNNKSYHGFEKIFVSIIEELNDYTYFKVQTKSRKGNEKDTFGFIFKGEYK